MNYEELTDEVVERLQPFAGIGIVVERLPETESQKTQVAPNEVRFTVIAAGSEYEGTNSTAQIAQDEKVFIQVLIRSTFLYGPKGVLNLASAVKTALTGFRPQNVKRLQVSKHHIIGNPGAEKIDNLWHYNVIFQGTSLHVENFTEDLSILLKKITYLDGNETVIVPPQS